MDLSFFLILIGEWDPPHIHNRDKSWRKDKTKKRKSDQFDISPIKIIIIMEYVLVKNTRHVYMYLFQVQALHTVIPNNRKVKKHKIHRKYHIKWVNPTICIIKAERTFVDSTGSPTPKCFDISNSIENHENRIGRRKWNVQPITIKRIRKSIHTTKRY